MLLNELAKENKKYLAYHDELSPKLWDGDVLKPDVLDALRNIAKEFIDTLGVPETSIIDEIITGSMCNYNYTKYSDIDLHIIIDYNYLCDDCEGFSIDDCMKAKKSLWNDRHDITIYGIDVELYAQDKRDKITGNAGVYSIASNSWLQRPQKLANVNYEHSLIMAKANIVMSEIDSIIDDKVNDDDVITKLQDKIKNMRKAGLERTGEYSMENLVFKILRNTGYIKQLYDYQLSNKDDTLSLE